MFEFVKLANELSFGDDLSQAYTPEQVAGMAGLSGMASFGAIKAKRDAEAALLKSLEGNVNAARLADQISANARARELLAGEGLDSAYQGIKSNLLNTNRMSRNLKATASQSLANVLKALQRNKIL